MQVRTSGNYALADRELIADRAVTDTFVCLEGRMVVETRAPRNDYVLTPGQRCAAPPRTTHYVHGEEQDPCKF